jgi:hypothetical protein
MGTVGAEGVGMIDHEKLLQARVHAMIKACDEHQAASQSLIDSINEGYDVPAMWTKLAEDIVRLADRLLYATRAVAECSNERTFYHPGGAGEADKL